MLRKSRFLQITRQFIALLIILGFSLMFAVIIYKTQTKVITISTYRGGVVSNAPECALIGKEIFEKGGSAMDVALSALFCEGVVMLQSMGIGGGFVMTIYNRSNRKIETLNSREIAPRKSTKDMFHGNAKLSSKGGLAVAVPGELKGYWEAHKKYGKLKWATLIEPTIKLCKEGVIISKFFSIMMQRSREIIENSPSLREKLFNPETGDLYQEGDRVKHEKLAETLEKVAAKGIDALYHGELSENFVKDIQDEGGIIDLEDLIAYKPRWEQPLSFELPQRKTLYTLGPPTSGALMAFILNVLNNDLTDKKFDNVINWQRSIETFKYAYGERTKFGDIGIRDLIDKLLSKEYGDKIRSRIVDNQTFYDPKYYGADSYQPEDHGTAHISVIDINGDAISVTSSINTVFGAAFISKSTGILLNNMMDDFSSPNIVNFYKIPPSPANFIEPGHRPLSSMCPSIILDENGDVILAVGAAGGTRISGVVALVTMRTLWFNESIQNAISAKRIHHQLFPMNAVADQDFDQGILDGLKQIGHSILIGDNNTGFAAVTGLARKGNSIEGGTDPRRSGKVVLFP